MGSGWDVGKEKWSPGFCPYPTTSEYAQEQVDNIVDSRYLSRLPFIVTTNLPLSDLQAPTDLAHARIYDRVLERCAPICFSGRNYRHDNVAANKNETAKLLTD